MKEIVLITNDKGHVRCGQYRGIGSFSKNDGRPHWNWKGNTLETVVAWMPLPEPYKEKERKIKNGDADGNMPTLQPLLKSAV